MAAAFLAFCGCLDNSKIHWNQFHWGYLPEYTSLFPPVSAPVCPWIEGLATDRFQKIQDDEGQYDNTIRCLLNFSFVRRDAETYGVSVHPIVHRCLLSLSGLAVQQQFCELLADRAGRPFLFYGTMAFLLFHEQWHILGKR